MTDSRPLRLIVCLKLIPDPDRPASTFAIDEVAKRVTPRGVPPSFSPFDENALEAALRLKDVAGAQVTVLSMGRNPSQRILLKALAAGADELVLVKDDACDALDGYASASALAAAIRTLDGFDLILTGRQAGDTDSAQVGLGVAELLGIPALSQIQAIEPCGDALQVEQVAEDGYRVYALPMPALVTVKNELLRLRNFNLKDMQAARKKPVRSLTGADLGIDFAELIRNEVVALSRNTVDTRCELIGGTDPEQITEQLAAVLQRAGVIPA